MAIINGYRAGSRARGGRPGQALLLAIVVMLMLALLAAAVVGVVASSLDESGRDEQRVRARLLAEAGLRYADEMLTQSAEGANWRPALPSYLTPPVAAADRSSYDATWDSYEVLRGWDAENVASSTPPGQTPVYFVKYRFQMDPVATSNDPNDPSQDFVTGYPDRPVENVEQTVPHDHFLLRVEYAPSPADPLSKYLKITSIGRPGTDVTAFQELVAYKPLGITDYGLFIHDRHRGSATAELGIPALDVNGSQSLDNNRDAFDGSAWATPGPNDFIPYQMDGPVRSNVDLAVLAPAVLRPVQSAGGWKERVEVAGRLTTVASAGADDGNAEVLVQDPAGAELVYSDQAPDPNAQVTTQADRIEAPALDTYEPVTGIARWDRLTRYSGRDNTLIWDGTAQVPVNSGELGYGRGIYVDNEGQRDSLDSVRNAWLQPETWGGRRYVPNGCFIELFAHYPNPLDPNAPPAIVITRTDGTSWIDPATGKPSGQRTMIYRFPDQDGTWSLATPGALDPADAATWPQPDNGLIVCEGNVRIQGHLPASTTGANYHLTIVSRGSIYVEGPLLRPSDYSSAVAESARENTRVALLARDNLVINPTSFAPGMLPGLPPGPFVVPEAAPTDAHFVLDPAGTEVIGIPVTVCRAPGQAGGATPPTPTRITVIQADGNPDDALAARSAVMLSRVRATLGVQPTGTEPATLTQPYLRYNDRPGRPGVLSDTQLLRSAGVPVFLADWGNLARALYPANPAPNARTEYFPDSFWVDPSNWNDDPANGELGVPSYVTVRGGIDYAGAGTASSRSDVIVKNMKLERLEGDQAAQPRPGLELVVSALLFAERGTLFVIPGEWFDPRASSPSALWDSGSSETITNADLAVAKFARLRRYNYRLSINGAIAVNSLPSLMEVGEWTDKWCYPTAGTGQTLFNDYGAVRYRYDWGLRTPAVGRDNLVRLPGLPAAPGLVYVGEENQQ